MNNKVNALIEQCRNYVPLDGRVLVHALKIRQIKQEDYTFDVADTKANEGKDPSKHRVDLKKVNPKVNAKYQEAVVLQVPFDETRFKVGDTVVYPIGSINPFDLVKGVSVLRKYDIAAVIINYEAGDEEEVNQIIGDSQEIMAGYSAVVTTV
jgi:hypothetical protein